MLTRRTLFNKLLQAAAGTVLARMPFVGPPIRLDFTRQFHLFPIPLSVSMLLRKELAPSNDLAFSWRLGSTREKVEKITIKSYWGVDD